MTNAEVHDIIRRHVSRFVPSLKEDPAVVSKSASSGRDPGAGEMAVEEQATQDAGISSTRCVFVLVSFCLWAVFFFFFFPRNDRFTLPLLLPLLSVDLAVGCCHKSVLLDWPCAKYAC